jgi:hypothetical protein
MADIGFIMKNPGETVAAIGALGTSAYGLVDTTKVFWGGISRVGYKRIKAALMPFAPALENALGANWANAIFSHWLNGVPLDEQKTKAKTLIRLGLTGKIACQIANAGKKETPRRSFDPVAPKVGTGADSSSGQKEPNDDVIDPDVLAEAVENLTTGKDLEPKHVNVLGRFDATVDAALDAAYERADQEYKNAARGLAAAFAVLLSLAAVYFVDDSWSQDILPAFIVGLVAIPLAPIAKDVSTALANAVTAMNKVTGKA